MLLLYASGQTRSVFETRSTEKDAAGCRETMSKRGGPLQLEVPPVLQALLISYRMYGKWTGELRSFVRSCREELSRVCAAFKPNDLSGESCAACTTWPRGVTGPWDHLRSPCSGCSVHTGLISTEVSPFLWQMYMTTLAACILLASLGCFCQQLIRCSTYMYNT